MKKKLWTIIPIALTLAACGGEAQEATDNEMSESTVEINKEGFPIVNKPIEMEFFVGKSPANQDIDWNADYPFWDDYAEKTGIDIEWNQVYNDALDEQRNLSLVQGDLPDAYNFAYFPNTEIFRYGNQGVFVPLNDLIEEYAPNLSALMEEYPEIRKSITFPDGNIYSMPAIMEEEFLSVRVGARPWINQVWLDELGMEVPETTEEFYDFLVAIQELDPVGDGKTIPFGGTSMDEVTGYLSGSFGVMNRGSRNGPIDYDEENDDIRFYAITEEYKELLQYINRLYSEGLIDPSIFTIEWGQFLANASENLYASMIFYDPIDLFGEEVGIQYNSMAALEGPNGDQMYTKVIPMVSDVGTIIITEDNENPAAVVRWMDDFYSDEGARLYYMGEEGVTYEEVDGELQYMDFIRNPADGQTFQQELAKHLPWIGQTQGILKAEYFNGSEAAPTSLEAAEKIRPYVPEIWGEFTYTLEENEALESYGADIEKYVGEVRDQFISGDMSFDQWNQYIETLENMGLDDYMGVKRAAYERYMAE